jgi:hypothetical protein
MAGHYSCADVPFLAGADWRFLTHLGRKSDEGVAPRHLTTSGL